MTQFNPITGAILVNQQAVTRQSAAQTEHIKRAQALAKNIAASGDRFEHEIESTEKIDATHDDNQKKQQQNQHDPDEPDTKDDDDDQPHVDLIA